jgi:hypothetical protein
MGAVDTSAADGARIFTWGGEPVLVSRPEPDDAVQLRAASRGEEYRVFAAAAAVDWPSRTLPQVEAEALLVL